MAHFLNPSDSPTKPAVTHIVVGVLERRISNARVDRTGQPPFPSDPESALHARGDTKVEIASREEEREHAREGG